MRTTLDVIVSPLLYLNTSFRQGQEPVLIETPGMEFAIETAWILSGNFINCGGVNIS